MSIIPVSMLFFLLLLFAYPKTSQTQNFRSKQKSNFSLQLYCQYVANNKDNDLSWKLTENNEAKKIVERISVDRRSISSSVANIKNIVFFNNEIIFGRKLFGGEKTGAHLHCA